MKILINAVSAKLGGIVTYTTNLAHSLYRRGIDFRVAVPEGLSELPNAVVFPASNYGSIRRFVWEQTLWRQRVAGWMPDILFSSANYSLLTSPVRQVLLVREGGLFDPFYMRMVAPEQGVKAAFLRYLRRRLILVSGLRSDRVIVPSETLLSLVLDNNPGLAKKCRVVSYGTPIDRFTGTGRRGWRVDGVLRMLYVGVYYPHKAPADLVLAAEQLSDEGIPCRVRLTMDEKQIEETMGSRWDLAHIRRGIAKGLVETGAVRYRDLADIYAAHDLFVFPSVSETFGHPMVEAMAAQIPIVAAATDINREILGDCAYYYPPLKYKELVNAVRHLDAQPEERERLVVRARQRVDSKFNWEPHVDRLLAEFEDVLNPDSNSESRSMGLLVDKEA